MLRRRLMFGLLALGAPGIAFGQTALRPIRCGLERQIDALNKLDFVTLGEFGIASNGLIMRGTNRHHKTFNLYTMPSSLSFAKGIAAFNTPSILSERRMRTALEADYVDVSNDGQRSSITLRINFLDIPESGNYRVTVVLGNQTYTHQVSSATPLASGLPAQLGDGRADQVGGPALIRRYITYRSDDGLPLSALSLPVTVQVTGENPQRSILTAQFQPALSRSQITSVEQAVGRVSGQYANLGERGEAKFAGGVTCSRSDTGCFFTTAAVHTAGLADDCWELRTLRAFRDGPMQRRDDWKALADAYDTIAPPIVQAIAARPDADRIWAKAWLFGIVPAACLAQLGQNGAAVVLYRRLVRVLLRYSCECCETSATAAVLSEMG